MHIQVTESIFIDAFRSIRPDQYTYEGLKALFAYFDDMGDEQDVELDVIAICCEYSEYESIADYNEQYGTTHEHTDDLEQETTVITIDGTERFIAVDI